MEKCFKKTIMYKEDPPKRLEKLYKEKRRIKREYRKKRRQK